MAKEIKWGRLTPTEEATLDELKEKGITVCAAPMEVESGEQLKTLGLTWDDIKTWHYGVTGIPVRPTPSDEATAEALQHDL